MSGSFPDGTSNTILFVTSYMVPGSMTILFCSGSTPGGAYLTVGTALWQPAPIQSAAIPGYAQSFQASQIQVALADASVCGITSSFSLTMWQNALMPADSPPIPWPDDFN
jgi:hypothetical protein